MNRFFPCLLLAVLIAGCSEDAPTTSTLRGSSFATLAEYVVLETIEVPTNEIGVISTTVLENGVTYKIRASGTFPIGGPGDGLADAEYADFSNPPASLLDNCGNVETGVDLGIGINDEVIDNVKTPFWGPYDSTHVYTVEWIGAGEILSFNYHDCNVGDNSGSLTVEILKAEEDSVEFMIDIKPGSDPNPINPGSKGVIPLAILGSEGFDVTTVDETTLSFGSGGASIAHMHAHLEDVNDDGFTDLVAHFRTQEVGVAAGDTELCLSAETTEGSFLEGCHNILTVPRER